MKLRRFLIVAFLIFIALFVVLKMHGKYSDVKAVRNSLSIESYSVGSSCLLGDDHIAILKKYLDKDHKWVYDVMVLDSNVESLVLSKVPQESITKCEE